MLKTILIIFTIYLSGFAVAWIIAKSAIKHYNTKESPLAGALFSWLVPIVLFLHTILYSVSTKYSKWIDGNEII